MLIQYLWPLNSLAFSTLIRPDVSVDLANNPTKESGVQILGQGIPTIFSFAQTLPWLNSLPLEKKI